MESIILNYVFFLTWHFSRSQVSELNEAKKTFTVYWTQFFLWFIHECKLFHFEFKAASRRFLKPDKETRQKFHICKKNLGPLCGSKQEPFFYLTSLKRFYSSSTFLFQPKTRRRHAGSVRDVNPRIVLVRRKSGVTIKPQSSQHSSVPITPLHFKLNKKNTSCSGILRYINKNIAPLN